MIADNIYVTRGPSDLYMGVLVLIVIGVGLVFFVRWLIRRSRRGFAPRKRRR